MDIHFKEIRMSSNCATMILSQAGATGPDADDGGDVAGAGGEV